MSNKTNRVYIRDCYEQLKPHVTRQTVRKGFILTTSGTIEKIPQSVDERHEFFKENLTP